MGRRKKNRVEISAIKKMQPTLLKKFVDENYRKIPLFCIHLPNTSGSITQCVIVFVPFLVCFFRIVDMNTVLCNLCFSLVFFLGNFFCTVGDLFHKFHRIF